jgi:hypothetical protein
MHFERTQNSPKLYSSRFTTRLRRNIFVNGPQKNDAKGIWTWHTTLKFLLIDVSEPVRASVPKGKRAAQGLLGNFVRAGGVENKNGGICPRGCVRKGSL